MSTYMASEVRSHDKVLSGLGFGLIYRRALMSCYRKLSGFVLPTVLAGFLAFFTSTLFLGVASATGALHTAMNIHLRPCSCVQNY
jgi:hypothetical protein